MAAFSVPELICHKRDGGRLSEEAIKFLIDAYAKGSLPEEQMAALAMAIYFQDMDSTETAAWTEAMLFTGTTLSFQDLGRPVVDKHSTGGVGDKVSLILAPLAAACGLTVPMVSGRGLGHTGGTLDKLEAIPGFSVDLDDAHFREVLKETGAAIISASQSLAPGDKRLYALRDVTATVSSIPLIVGSIMSKKLAEGLDALVLDVKVGPSAFMTTREKALDLARRMMAVGEGLGVKTKALLSRMEEPLGKMIGNLNEVHESIAILKNEGENYLRDLVLEQASLMVAMGHGLGQEEAYVMAKEALSSGKAYEHFSRMVRAQGGRLEKLPPLPEKRPVLAGASGILQDIDGLLIAKTLVHLGAGRQQANDPIDHQVGFQLEADIGDEVKAGTVLGYLLQGQKEASKELLSHFSKAFILGEEAKKKAGFFLEWV